MWLNTKGFTLPHGLGAGGNTSNFRLFIPESLEECVGGSACTTFDVGPLASTKAFELHALEVSLVYVLKKAWITGLWYWWCLTFIVCLRYGV